MIGRRTVGLTFGMMAFALVTPGFTSLVRGCATVNQTLPLRDLPELASRIRLRFPAGSRLVEGEWHNALNTFGYAKVSFPADAWREFLAQPPFEGAYDYSNKPRNDIPIMENPIDPEFVARWQLKEISTSISASGGALNSAPTHMPVHVFIDLTDRAAPVVYLNWYN